MEFELNGQAYRADKLSAMKQFHIVRRLAPVLAGLAPMADRARLSALAEAAPAEFLPQLAKTLAQMTDEDAEFVIYGLLGAVKKKESGGLGWSGVVVNGQLMYQNLSMAEMMQLAVKAGQYNLSDFLAALPQLSSGAAQS